jgi:YtkA-like
MPQASWSMLLAAATLLGSACSDEGTPQGPAGTQGQDANGQPLPTGSVDCTGDPRLGDYLGTDTMGELGVLAFRLEQVQPAPPARGSNTFQLQIHDTAGAPMVGELRVDLRMPDHGHGTSVRPRISAGSDGQYTIEQLYLFMPGVWRIELDVREGSATIDRKALFFCIEG